MTGNIEKVQVTNNIEKIASLSGVTVQYILDMIRLNVIEHPDVGKEWSEDVTVRVVNALRKRRAKLVEGMAVTVRTDSTREETRR